MTTNPYQSPQAESVPPKASSQLRDDALKSLHLATVLLTTAGLFNFYAYVHSGYREVMTAHRIFLVLSLLQLIVIGITVIACWFLVLPILEILGQRIQWAVASKVDREEWNDALYVSLKPAALLAVPGFVLWITWTIGFYYLGVSFLIISYAVGIPAHILAACLYVPLLFRWYQLWRTSVPRPGSNAS